MANLEQSPVDTRLTQAIAVLRNLPELSLIGKTEDEISKVAQTIIAHIDAHKWFINKDIPFTVSFEQAAFSWHENVYKPIVHELNVLGFVADWDTFKAVSDSWWLSLKKGFATPRCAVLTHYRGILGWWGRFWLAVRSALAHDA